MAALTGLVIVLLLVAVSTSAKTPSQADHSVSVSLPPTLVSPAPTNALSPIVSPSVAVSAPQDCRPVTVFAAPPQINLANQASGLTEVKDAPSYYQIYGNTAAQVRAQIQHCAPDLNPEGARFAAATDYNLSWQYSSTLDNTGLCKLSNVKIGLHTDMILPLWQPTNSAASGLAAAWQKFIANLAIHEDGHIAIYQQYAGQLLGDLQSSSASDCAAILGSVQSKVAASVAANRAANDAYDASTNHGATQGAILP